MNLAEQRWQSLVCGSVGMLPLWERILERLPPLVRTTDSGIMACSEGGSGSGRGASRALWVSKGGGRGASTDIVVG